MERDSSAQGFSRSRNNSISRRPVAKHLREACAKGDVQGVKSLLLKLDQQQQQHEAGGGGGSRRKSSQRHSKEPQASSPDREDVSFAGNMPIHTACQQREPSRDVVELLLTKGGSSILDKTVSGDTALHVSCAAAANRGGTTDLDLVKALLSLSEQSSIRECLKHQNREGNTPLHLAALAGSHDLTSLLLSQCMPVDSKQTMGKTNKLGDTTLGVAVKGGHWDVAALLLRHSCSNPVTFFRDFLCHFPECELVEGLPPLLDHEPTNVIVLGDPKSSKTTLASTLHYAAQGTLSKFFSSLGGRPQNESFKCCIAPLTVEYRRSDHKCPFTFHDVSGMRSYAQEAVFSCSKDPLEALYVITVDARVPHVEEVALYWLSFLKDLLSAHRHCIDDTLTKTSMLKVKVCIALTFCDLVSSSRLQAMKKIDFMSIVDNVHKDSSSFEWFGSFNLNARKQNLLDMPLFISMLHKQCTFSSSAKESEREAGHSLAQTYVLASLLLKEYSSTDIVTFSVLKRLVKDSGARLCRLLPVQDKEIEKICHNLWVFNTFKLLTFNAQSTNWYILLDYKYFLRSVEEALEKLSQHAKNGMVAPKQIQDAFAFPTDFVIRFLEHRKLCELVNRKGLESMMVGVRSSRKSKHSISSNRSTHESPSVLQEGRLVKHHRRTKSESDTLDIDGMAPSSAPRNAITKKASEMSSSVDISSERGKERPIYLNVGKFDVPSKSPSPTQSQRSSARRSSTYYYFPSFIPDDQPEEFSHEEEYQEYTYGFSWSLVPKEGESWFLSPKFIAIILFRLLFSFAPHPPKPKTFVERLCKLWKRGIIWSDPQGARTCVAVCNDNKVTLSMQCLQKYEVACLSIRNEIMADIRQVLSEIHPDISPRELFAPLEGVSAFPIVDPLAQSCVNFDKDEIWQAIAEDRPAICTQGKHHKAVESLLHFEPLCYLPCPLLVDLFSEEMKLVQVSDDFCMQLAMNLSTKWTYLAEHFRDTVVKKYFIDSLVEDVTMKAAPYNTAMELLAHLKVIDYKDESDRVDTYGGLQKSLFEISIFSPSELVSQL